MGGSATNSSGLPVTAPAGPRRQPGSTGPGRVVLAHAALAPLGTGLLVWAAHPFAGPVTRSLPNAGYWQLLAVSALVVGVLGGALEGLALRHGSPVLAVAVLVAACVPGSWLPLLTLGRWFPGQGDDPIATGSLVGGVAGWLMLMAVLAAVAAVTGRRRVSPDGR